MSSLLLKGIVLNMKINRKIQDSLGLTRLVAKVLGVEVNAFDSYLDRVAEMYATSEDLKAAMEGANQTENWPEWQELCLQSLGTWRVRTYVLGQKITSLGDDIGEVSDKLDSYALIAEKHFQDLKNRE